MVNKNIYFLFILLLYYTIFLTNYASSATCCPECSGRCETCSTPIAGWCKTSDAGRSCLTDYQGNTCYWESTTSNALCPGASSNGQTCMCPPGTYSAGYTCHAKGTDGKSYAHWTSGDDSTPPGGACYCSPNTIAPASKAGSSGSNDYMCQSGGWIRSDMRSCSTDYRGNTCYWKESGDSNFCPGACQKDASGNCIGNIICACPPGTFSSGQTCHAKGTDGKSYAHLTPGDTSTLPGGAGGCSGSTTTPTTRNCKEAYEPCSSGICCSPYVCRRDDDNYLACLPPTTSTTGSSSTTSTITSSNRCSGTLTINPTTAMKGQRIKFSFTSTIPYTSVKVYTGGGTSPDPIERVDAITGSWTWVFTGTAVSPGSYTAYFEGVASCKCRSSDIPYTISDTTPTTIGSTGSTPTTTSPSATIPPTTIPPTTTLPPVTQFTLSCDKESMRVGETMKCYVKDCIDGLWIITNIEKTHLDPLTHEPIRDIPLTEIEIRPTTDGRIKVKAICFEPIGMRRMSLEKLIRIISGSTISSPTTTSINPVSTNLLPCWPTSGRITQGSPGRPSECPTYDEVGNVVDRSCSHQVLREQAIDIGASEGQDVYAAHRGTISKINKVDYSDPDERSGYGNYVDISTPRGFKTRYTHLSSIEDTLTEGQRCV